MSAGKQKADRGAPVRAALGENAYAIIDGLIRIGEAPSPYARKPDSPQF